MMEPHITETMTEPTDTTPISLDAKEQIRQILGRRTRHQSVKIETKEPVEPEAMKTAAEEVRKETPDIPQASEPDGFDEMLVANVANMDAFSCATEALIKGMSNLNAEMASFAESRIQANFERTRSLLKTSDPADLVELQVNFARSAAEQYFAEITRLLNLATQVTEESWAPIRDRVDVPVRLAISGWYGPLYWDVFAPRQGSG